MRCTGSTAGPSPPPLAPAWPNVSFHDNVYRWTDDAGRITYCTFQEIWIEKHQRAMRQRYM